MEIQNVEEFIEKPVIDIDIEAIGAPPRQWTINDTPEAKFHDGEKRVRFFIPEFNRWVSIERRNAVWIEISRRIDKIPVKKPKPSEEGAKSRLDVNRK